MQSWLIGLITCIFTISVSVGGAYAVLKSNDAITETKLTIFENQIGSINQVADQLQKQNNMLYVEISKVRESNNDMKLVVSNMTTTNKELSDNINKLTIVLARFDERIKYLEKR